MGDYGDTLEVCLLHRAHGKERPYTATTYDNIGLVPSKEDDEEVALETYRIRVREKDLGREHSDIATITII